ncbi:MAG: 5-dehydro-4-deoxy-D-glucuronate isomerase [Acholeplasmatales bacterium]|nr:5-dehydro-4-deoxy-D-glucuronate isomerase [Acholeplasmatales bacterium]
MKFDVRYANHPDDTKNYDTETLRKNFLIESVFEDDDVVLTYSHQDRIIVGGIKPVTKSLKLEGNDAMRCAFFLERREMAFINVGGAGKVTLDGASYDIMPRDGMYIGMGVKEIEFTSVDPKNPAKFYMSSSPAHKTYPTVYIAYTKENLDAFKGDIKAVECIHKHLGDEAHMNKRVINQYVNTAIIDSCQLAMGMTALATGSCWNTMPCHLHERRMEVYYYFDFDEEDRVFHLMGRPDETRHIVMGPDQAVISPAWSIHAASATNNYTFIWAMCGENQDYDDQDWLKTKDLK